MLLRLSGGLLCWVGLLVGGALAVLGLAESCAPDVRWSAARLCQFLWRWFPSIVMPGLLLLGWWAVGR